MDERGAALAAPGRTAPLFPGWLPWTLAAVPLVQFLSLGYLLESSARVARAGRLRDGFIGVRKAARLGSVASGILLSLLPVWLVRSLADSAELIDPGGPGARGWRVAVIVLSVATSLHIAVAGS